MIRRKIKRPKWMRGLSHAWLLSLWRRVVVKRYGYRCVFCGQEGGLEAHHIVHRRVRCLCYDPDNGVPVCATQQAPQAKHGESCHQWADTIEGRDYLRGFLGAEIWAKLAEKQHVLKRDELVADGLSEREWRARWKAALMAELKKD